MRFGLRDDIYNKIIDIANKYNYNFFVFGSRARGDYRNNSDIDIAIFEDVLKEDENKIRNEFDKIDMEYTVDLVFITEETKKELVENIQKEGIEIK